MNKKIWNDLDEMIRRGKIRSTIYEHRYEGLDQVPQALKDLAGRKIWGKAVVKINPMADEKDPKARL